MKRAKRRPNPSINHLYLAWDGSLNKTPKHPDDPQVKQFFDHITKVLKGHQ